MKKLLLAATAVGLATAAILAASGSAQDPPRSLTLTETVQKQIGFFPKHAPRQGTRFGFGGKISGDDTGFDRGVCTAIGNLRTRNPAAKVTLCTLQLAGSSWSPFVVLSGVRTKLCRPGARSYVAIFKVFVGLTPMERVVLVRERRAAHSRARR